MEALCRISPASVLARVVAKVDSNPEAECIGARLIALGPAAADSLIDVLPRLPQDYGTQIWRVIDLLHQTHDPRVPDVLLKYLESMAFPDGFRGNSFRVPQHIGRALRQTLDSATLERLVRLIDFTVYDISHTSRIKFVIEVLKEIGGSQVVNRMLDLLPEDKFAPSAAEVLGELADEKCIGPMADAAKRQPAQAYQYALLKVLQRCAATASEADLASVADLPDGHCSVTKSWGEEDYHTIDFLPAKELAQAELRRRHTSINSKKAD